MSTTGLGAGALDEQVGDAEAVLRGLAAPAAETADAIDQAFARAGDSLARSLARAAADGKVSLKDLAGAVLSAVDAAAGVSSPAGGLGTALGEVFKDVFAGARADGGAVSAGGAYVVGERGPEVFRPAVSGTVDAAAGGPAVNVTVMVTGGAEALARSEAQVAAALQRAVRMGVR